MSVYKRPGAETYSFDFWLGGLRHSGETGRTSKREALAFQEGERRRVAAELKEAAGFNAADMTFADASALYWDQVGQFHVNARQTLDAIEWLQDAIGGKTRVRDIDDSRVAALVAKRRSEVRRVGKVENRGKRVGAATVNRTMTEPLRKILRRVRKVAPIQEIAWGERMLAEPQERVREASGGEEAAIMTHLDRGYDAAVAFALLSGCRRMEIVGLAWSRVDFFGRQFTVTGKGGRSRLIPMSDEIFNLLWAQRGRHETSVFAYQAARTDKRKKIARGLLYPMTDAGLRTAMRRAVALSGVENFRFHDTRHTAATRVLRVSNLRVVQVLLGHQNVATTTKYAHALAEDVRAALNAAGPTKSPTAAAGDNAKIMTEKGKVG